MTEERIFHIAGRAEWEDARASGRYRAASLRTEGFIHFSTARQWPRVLRERFRGGGDLVLLEVDVARLSAPLRYEDADGDSFPHLYGELPVEAVVAVHALAPR